MKAQKKIDLKYKKSPLVKSISWYDPFRGLTSDVPYSRGGEKTRCGEVEDIRMLNGIFFAEKKNVLHFLLKDIYWGVFPFRFVSVRAATLTKPIEKGV